MAQRARIVLLAADGVSNTEIAKRVGVSRPTEIDEVDVVVATLADEGRPPQRLGATHWSARLLAAELGVGFATVARIWRKWNLQPWRVETFRFSTDPELDAKIRDVVGLYLAPPENAVVLCVDEKSQIQALDRTAPVLPILPAVPAKQTHDYVRNGTTTCSPRSRWPPERSPRPASPGTATRSSCASSSRSPRPTRAASSMS